MVQYDIAVVCGWLRRKIYVCSVCMQRERLCVHVHVYYYDVVNEPDFLSAITGNKNLAGVPNEPSWHCSYYCTGNVEPKVPERRSPVDGRHDPMGHFLSALVVDAMTRPWVGTPRWITRLLSDTFSRYMLKQDDCHPLLKLGETWKKELLFDCAKVLRRSKSKKERARAGRTRQPGKDPLRVVGNQPS